MTKKGKKAACDILKYVQKQPQAKHTVEGIAKYWIFQQRMEEELDIVMSALDFLVQEGFLEKVQKENGDSYYRVNKQKIAEIPETLKLLQGKNNR